MRRIRLLALASAAVVVLLGAATATVATRHRCHHRNAPRQFGPSVPERFESEDARITALEHEVARLRASLHSTSVKLEQAHPTKRSRCWSDGPLYEVPADCL